MVNVIEFMKRLSSRSMLGEKFRKMLNLQGKEIGIIRMKPSLLDVAAEEET